MDQDMAGRAAAGAALRDHFMGWQCRIRAIAVRADGGRPSAGMRPRVGLADGGGIAPAVTVLIVPADPAPATAQFRQIVHGTHDPRERRDKALALLSATYFQMPGGFADAMTALFAPGLATAAALTRAGRCVLAFEQFSQRYSLPAAVGTLGEADPAWQATYWHNALFNAAMPPRPDVLSFTPDWPRGSADPGVRSP